MLTEKEAQPARQPREPHAGPLAARVARHWARRPKRGLLAVLGPGLITGASDDDPSGIATYSQAGAQFGYGLLWTLLLTYPLMSAIQLVSAHIGRVTGRGLARNLRSVLPPWLVNGLVGLLFVAGIEYPARNCPDHSRPGVAEFGIIIEMQILDDFQGDVFRLQNLDLRFNSAGIDRCLIE